MANIAFCTPNWTLPTKVYTPAITAPGWIDLGNLQGDVLSEMARYPGTDPASTVLELDLKTVRAVRVFAIPISNAKPGDTARVLFYTDAARTDLVLDTGDIEFYGEVYPWGALQWGRQEWLDGRMTTEQVASAMASWRYWSKEEVLGRYVKVMFNFSGNSDGFVDVGQIVVSPAFSPQYNLSFGCTPPFYRDPSTTKRSKGGVQFVDKARPYLYTKMQLDWLSENEAYGNFFEMVREYGVSKPFYFIYDPDAPAALIAKQSFMAKAETISDPVHPSVGTFSIAIELSQTF